MGCGVSRHTVVQSNKDGTSYETIKKLGHGASCTVYSVRSKETGEKYAMKQLNKSTKGEDENLGLWEMECKLLKIIGNKPHDNVLQYIDSFSSPKAYFILTQLYEGGELFDKITDGKFSEKKAAQYAEMMLRSVAHCHSLSIVHRDLKPENYVFSDKGKDAGMRLIDFGVARVLKDTEFIEHACGSPYYVAPEVLNTDWLSKRNGLTWKASDMWSCGIIIFMFLVGYPPFNSSEDKPEVIYDKIQNEAHKWPKWAWAKLSPEGLGLVNGLLHKDPFKRLTAQQALNHPWIKNNSTLSDEPVDKSVIEALSNFRNACNLKKAVGKVMSGHMTEDDTQKVEKLFKQFDQNGDGRLGKDEIAALMAHIGQGSDAAALLADADADGDGELDIHEIKDMQATAALEKQTDQQLKETFKMFDKSGDGFICATELQMMCKMDKNEAEKLIADADSSDDGKIDFNEWVKAMKTRTGH